MSSTDAAVHQTFTFDRTKVATFFQTDTNAKENNSGWHRWHCWCFLELRARWHPEIITKAIVVTTKTGEVAAVLHSKLEWDLCSCLHSLVDIPSLIYIE